MCNEFQHRFPDSLVQTHSVEHLEYDLPTNAVEVLLRVNCCCRDSFFFFHLLLGGSPFAIALRISFIPFSTHSQSVCMRVGMAKARMAHVATSSSPLTYVWPVRALFEKCMFSSLSFEK